MSRSRRSKSSGETHASLGNFILHWGAKLIFLTTIVVVVLSLVQCTIKKPEAPVWDTQLTVPLVNRTYAMPEIISKIDQDAISFDNDSNVVFSVEQGLDTVELDASNLTTASLNYNVSQQLGEISIAAPSVDPAAVSLASIPGLPQIFPATVPVTSFDIATSFPPVAGLTMAQVSSGQIWVVATNNLGIDLSSVILSLDDNGFFQSLGSASFSGGITDGESDSLLFDLGGKTISNSFAASTICQTNGGTITSPDGKQFEFAIHFPTDLSVTAATAEVPALSRDFGDAVSLQESDIITGALLNGGQIALTVTNNSALDATLDISIPDLKLGGVPLTLSQPISAFGSEVVNIGLAGYQLAPADVTLPQQLPVNISAVVPGSGSNQVTVNSSNNFSVQASLSGLSFSSVTGVFTGTSMTIAPIVQAIDVPTGFDSVQLVNAILTIEIENSVGLPGDLNVTLNGNNGKTLNIAGTVDARILATAATTIITEPDIADFLSPIPSQVTITGSASFGAGTSGTIRDGDYITGTVRIDSPVEMIIPETPIDTDIESETIEQDDIDKITDHVIEARLIYNIINHLPVGATVNLLMSGDSATLYANPQLRFDNISVDAAPVVGSVVVDTLSTGYQSILLDSADIQILKNDTLYIGQELILHSSNGQPVRLTKDDFVTVVGRIEVEYRFDGEF